jgi:Reverse transcriptase (RNA-dependent DNA polymerase)/Retroviral aspartyl protease
LTMCFTGSLGGQRVKVALDSQASHSFMNSSLLGLQSFKVDAVKMDVKLGNRSVASTSGMVKSKLMLGSFASRVQLHLLPLNNDFDVILGDDWLTNNKAILDFDAGICKVKKGTKAHTLRRETTGEDGLASATKLATGCKPSSLHGVLSAMQVKRVLRKGAQLLVLELHSVEDIANAAAGSPDGTSQVTGHENPEIATILSEYEDVFRDIPPGLPPHRNTAHAIPLVPGTRPVARPMYRLSPAEHREVQAQIKEGLEKGWIEPSFSPWAAPILFVHKKGGGLRMCVDYRALNKHTVKNRFPLPRIDDLFDNLQGAKFFTSLDLASGYHQIRIPEEDRPKTAFRTSMGLYQYRVLSFGLTNAPATFQAAMNELFAPYLHDFVLVYLDDILVYSKTWEEHLLHLKLVLQKLREQKFYCRLWKCHFGQKQVEYLGHIIEDGHIKVDPNKVKVVHDWPVPRTVSDVRSFLGFCNYFRRFIENYSTLAAPLSNLTKKNCTWV